MSGIERVGPVAPGRPGVRAAAGASAGFLPLADMGADAARSAGAAASAPVALDSLLALQQVDEPAERDRTVHRRGQALLGALGRLQRLLLEDGDQTDALEQIRSLAEAMPAAADPGLADAVDLIVLRARIELARRGG